MAEKVEGIEASKSHKVDYSDNYYQQQNDNNSREEKLKKMSVFTFAGGGAIW
jgi:hypothetical protein